MRVISALRDPACVRTGSNEAGGATAALGSRRASRFRRLAPGFLAGVLACALALPQAAFAGPLQDAAAVVSSWFSDDGAAAAPVAVGDADHVVSDTRSPANASLNLFDYWITDENASDKNDPSGWENMGINEGKQFRFSDAGRYDRPETHSINGWTGRGEKPFQGIVQNRLDENGYPVLQPGNVYQFHKFQGQGNLKTTAQPLAYLFDDSDVKGKRAYRDVHGLVQYVDGYYVYDSSKNYASYDKETNDLALFKQPAVSNNAGNVMGQFFPFDAPDEVFEEKDGALVAKNIKSTHPSMNHYFGAELTADFVQMPGGMTGDQHTVFNFSGDDDVWVFVDGVLVGDVGGVHGAAALSIDFATGEVSVQDARQCRESYEPIKTTIRACYEEALGAEAAQAYLEDGTNTLKDGSYHTLKFFYLERGNTDSNMKLTFNLPQVAESKIEKDNQDGVKVAGARFELYAADENYGIIGDAPLSQATTDANGTFVLKTQDGSRPLDFSELASKGVDRFVLREVQAPEGYRVSPDAHLRYAPSKGDGQQGFLVSDNTFDSGVYARPYESVSVNPSGIVKTADVEGVPERQFKVGEDNTVFAVLFKYDRDGDHDWHAIGGSRDAWSVGGPVQNIADLNALYADGTARAFVSDGDTYAVDLGELPGDPEDYRFMAAEGAQDIDYSIGYFLTELSRDELAAGKKMTDANTFWLESLGKKGNFIRKSYASLHVTDVSSGFAVQKVDDAGSAVNGAVFGLYRADQMDEQLTAPMPDQQPVRTERTSDMTADPSMGLDGVAWFTGLAEGTYYLVEQSTPEGYVLNATPVRVIVDETGVYADAGDANDGIDVRVGAGSLVDAMSGFASNDQIEVTLHDVVAYKQEASCVASGRDFHIESWAPVRDAAGVEHVHLRYDDATPGHTYIANEEKPDSTGKQPYFVTDEGMMRAGVVQDPAPAADKHGMGTWEDLGARDLTHVFTGTTVVRVTNERAASLEVEKRVNIPEGLQGPDNVDELDFTFKFSFSKDGAPLDGDFTARVFATPTGDDPLVQHGDDFTVANGQTHTLKAGETMRVYGLPAGTSYVVEEPPASMPPGFVQSAPHAGDGGPSAGPGNMESTVETGAPDHGIFVNTYRPAPAQIAPAQLGVQKVFASDDGSDPWTTAPDATFEFVLQQLTEGSPMPEGSVEGADGVLEKSIVVDAADKDAGYRAFFESVRFGKPGIYHYAVSERTPDPAQRIPGVTYSDAAFIVAAHVSDGRDGMLHAEVMAAQTNDDAGVPVEYRVVSPQEDGSIVLPFSNTMSRTAVSMGPLASKTLTGRDFGGGPGGGEFAFRMKPVGEHAATQPMPAGSTGVGADRVMEVRNNGATVSFGQSTYTHDDMRDAPYYYELWEEAPADARNADGVAWRDADDAQKAAGGFVKAGVTYDARRYVARVSLATDGPHGESMTARIDYFEGAWNGSVDGLVAVPQEGDGAGKVPFENIYEAKGSFIGVQAAKLMMGRAMADGEFRFDIEGLDDASTAKLSGLSADNATFTAPGARAGQTVYMGPKLAMDFTQADVGTKFEFKVTERQTSDTGAPLPGVSYDASVYRLELSVSDNGDGTLDVQPKVYLEIGRQGQGLHELLDLGLITDPETGLITLDFMNDYAASSSYAGFEVAKTMHGKDMAEGDFGFTVVPVGRDAIDKMYANRAEDVDLQQEGSFVSPAASAGEKASMGTKLAVDFDLSDAGKTFEYQVFEDVDAAADDDAALAGVQREGVTYDRSRFRVAVSVADAGDGTLDVTTRVERICDKVTGADLEMPELIGDYRAGDGRTPEVHFENSYAAVPVSASAVLLDKALTGRDWREDDAFSFHFEQTAFHDMDGVTHVPGDADYVAGPVIDDVTVTMGDEGGLVDGTRRFGFEDVVFDTVGMYRYEVSEVVPDDAVNAEGVAWTQASDEQKAAGGFCKDGIVYSNETATVSVSVWDYGYGRLIAVPIVSKPDADTGAHFSNVYESKGGSVSTDGLFGKELIGRDWRDGDAFSFEMRAADPVDAPMPDGAIDGSIVAQATADDVHDGLASFGFGSIAYTLDDLRGVEADANGARSKDFVYEVGEIVPADAVNAAGVLYEGATAEQKAAGGFAKAGVVYDGHTARLTVRVTDDGRGGLQADARLAVSARASDAVFSNAYEAALDYAAAGGLQLEKTLNGRDMEAGQFAFEMTARDGVGASASDAAAKAGFAAGSLTRSFSSPAAEDGAKGVIDLMPDGLRFDASDAGKTYVYEVRESQGGGTGYIDDATVYTVSIALADDGAGVLRATTTVSDGDSYHQVYEVRPGAAERVIASVPFENAYAAEGQVVVEGAKRLTGRPLAEGEFSFSLSLVSADSERTKVVGSARNAADGTFAFAPLSVSIDALKMLEEGGYAQRADGAPHSAWTLRYRVSEDASSLPGGVSVTHGSFDVEATIVDKGDGVLETVLDYPQRGAFIDNAYSAGAPVAFAPHGSKMLAYADGLDPDDIAGKFTFTLEGVDDAPMPEDGLTSVVNDAAGNVDFGAILFSQDLLEDVEPAADGSRSKTFSYRVRESVTPGADTAGITNDPQAVKMFEVVLTDDGKGSLSVASTAEDALDFRFVNTYEAAPAVSSVSDAVSVDKVLHGRPLRAGEFSFALVEQGADVAASVASNDADGRVTFPAMTYDRPGVHVYALCELSGGAADGVAYDTAVYTVRTEVRDGGRGVLEVSHELFDAHGASVSAATFENVYEPAPTTVVLAAGKLLHGADLTEGRFSFELRDETGVLVSTARNTADGTVAFAPLRFDASMMEDAAPGDDGLPVKTFVYTITEVDDGQEGIAYDSSVVRATVTVVDDLHGSLKATSVVYDDDAVFENVCEQPASPADPEGGGSGGSSGSGNPAGPDGFEPSGPSGSSDVPDRGAGSSGVAAFVATGDGSGPFALIACAAAVCAACALAIAVAARRRS
ncbi:MAG: FctA domain-containing protein [Slackia sp.]|nr:FctA domain-containing protein [Slackia sp.]